MAEMRRRGISFAKLADTLSISEVAVRRKCQGLTKRGFTAPEKRAICELLGVEPTEENYERLFTLSA